MRRLRLAVIGAGSWTVASHLPNLARRPEVDFVGVCRLGGEPLAAIAAEWGFPVASEDYRDVLATDPDLVLVAGPAAWRHEHTRAALEAGAHVLVEKPFTLSSAQAWDLVELARERQREIVVALGYNHKPVVAAAASLMAEYGVGEIESVSVVMCSGTRTLLTRAGGYVKAAQGFAPDPATWTDPALSGGGYAQAQLSHALGVALQLTGLRGEQVFALGHTPPGGSVEIDNAAVVGYRGGAIGTVSGASAHPDYLAERDLLQVRIVGDRAQLDVDFSADAVTLHRPGAALLSAPLEPGDGSYDCDGPPNRLVDLALGRTDENPSPGELGARSVEIIEAMYASAATGTPVIISDHAHPLPEPVDGPTRP